MAYVKADAWVLQQIASTGLPLVGGSVSAYITGTTTPLAMYTSSAGAGSATSFTLNSLGMPQSAGGTAVDIYLDDASIYKFIIRDSSGVAVGPTIDPVYPSGGNGTSVEFASLEALRASSTDADYVTVLAANAGGTAGRMNLYNNGATGTPTTNGNRFTALAAGTFFNAAGNGYARMPDVDATVETGGGVADGSTDCADVIEDNNSLRELPAGKIKISTTVDVSQARYFYGRMPPGTTPQSSGSTQTYIQHDFSGAAFDFSGSTNDLESAGGGLKDLSIIQNHGDGTTNSGIAIRAVATATVRPNWLKFENVNVEEVSGKNGWQYGLYIDGSAHSNSIRNIWVDRCRFVAGTLATKAVSIRGVANAFITACMGNLTNGHLEITGGSASVFVNDSTFANLEVDNASNVYVTGGSYQAITTTSNTTNAVFMTAVSNGIPTLAGSRNYFCGLDIANSRYLFYSSASPFVFFVPGGVTEFVGNSAVANDAQILVEGRYNGYGAGIRAVSRTSSGGTRVNMGRLTWQGTAAWDTTAANQDSKAVISAAEDGVETDVAEFRAPGVGETGLLLLHNGSMKRVTVGAADSGGVGYRLLRVTN